MQEFFSTISDAYLISGVTSGGKPFAVSLYQIVDEFSITLMEARKLFIIARVYHTEISNEVNTFKAKGKFIDQIIEYTEDFCLQCYHFIFY